MTAHDAPSPATATAAPRGNPPGTAAPLTARVEPPELQRLQERFTALVGVSTCICDTRGRPVTEPTWASRYLQLLSRSRAGRALIHAGMRECSAGPRSIALPFSARTGMALYGTPILHEDRPIATIVIGVRPPAPLDEAAVGTLARRCGVEVEALIEAGRLLEPWSPDQRDATFRFVDLLADMIGTLFAKSEQIHRQLDDLRIIHEFTMMLSGSRDLQEILDLTTRRVHETLGVKACAIRLLDEDTGELVIRAVHDLSPAYLNKGRILLRENPIDRAAFDGQAVTIEDARTDPRIRFRQSAIDEGIVSGLCVGMTYRGRTLGVLRVYAGAVRRFSDEEINLLRSIGSQAAAAITHARLAADREQSRRLSRQMRHAGQIQRRMIPAAAPPHDRLEIGAVYAPSLDVGGDFYDFIELPGSRLGVCIADVVGKGIPAALMMASVRSTLRVHAPSTPDIAEVVSLVNRQMCRDTALQEFATLFYGVFDRDARRLEYCNAGHEAPVLLRDRQFTTLDRGGMLVGVFPDVIYEKGECTLRPGDILILATDGTIEALDFQGNAYGRDRFRRSILRHQHLDATHMARQLRWDVRRFKGLAHQSDDIAIVVIKVQESA